MSYVQSNIDMISNEIYYLIFFYLIGYVNHVIRYKNYFLLNFYFLIYSYYKINFFIIN